jgi:hypothetical protein
MDTYLLSSDDSLQLVPLSEGSLPGSESLLQELAGSLVELWIIELVKFEGSLFVWGETTDALHDLANHSASVAASSDARWLSSGVSLSDEESFVQSDCVSLNCSRWHVLSHFISFF